MTKQKRPYGSWPSVFSAQMVGGKQKRFGHMQAEKDKIYWLEGRPEEDGRVVLMVKEPDKAPHELTPSSVSVKSKVHEYGGGDFIVSDDRVYFVNAFDQNIYEIGPEGMVHITHAYGCRFADLFHDQTRNRLLAVCEDHSDGTHLPDNKIVTISLDDHKGTVSDLFTGDDFYANPAISECGTYLSFISWSRPHMPWEAARLSVCKMDQAGVPGQVINSLGGVGQAVFQPTWRGQSLYFVCEYDQWNNICVSKATDDFAHIECVWEDDADFGRPQWVFGQRSYAFLDEERIAASYFEDGVSKYAVYDLREKNATPISISFQSLDMIDVAEGLIVGYVADGDMPSMLVSFSPENTKEVNIIRPSADAQFKPDDVSHGKHVSFPTRDGAFAHGLFYPPQNAAYEGLDETSPPMIVSAHGGPTGMADRGLKLKIQYWTSRGFAFLDVDYRGSSGYGKKYREALNGLWGKLDVTDVVDGALWCVSEGLADKDKLIISGSSAGGLTVLNALSHHTSFHAGACYYAVSDLQALCEDTHKFEIDYLYSLTGSNPENSAPIFESLSPKYHFTEISAPVIFFQGGSDPIVPASQSRHMFTELKSRGAVVAYTEFEGEGHGFRKEETLMTALSQEYYFYGKVLGFESFFHKDEDQSLEIENFSPRYKS